MSQITLRGLEPEIERKIRKKAKKSGKSLNRVILYMISQNAGLNRKKNPLSDSLRKLAGGWGEKEASDFFDSIRSCGQIDETIWK